MRIPNTRFSTCLSGTAQETELRLRSIFQWKKKRPPLPLLATVLLVAVGCGGLVACRATPPQEPPVGDSFGDDGRGDLILEEDDPQPAPVDTVVLQDVTFTYDDLTVEITNVADVAGGWPETEDGHRPMYRYQVTSRSVATVLKVDPTPEGEENRWCFYKDGTLLQPGQAWTVPITPDMEPLPLDESIIGIARNPDFSTVLELTHDNEDEKPFLNGWDAPLTTQEQAEAMQPKLRDILPDDAADAWFTGKKVMNQLFYTDGAYSVGQVYGHEKVDTSEPVILQENGYPISYCPSTIPWAAFESDMLKYFTPECFQWLLDNQMHYKPDENGMLLCPDDSDGSIYSAMNLGYVPVSITEDRVEFLEIASYQQFDYGIGGPSAVHTIPCAMQRTEKGWRIETIYPYM